MALTRLALVAAVLCPGAVLLAQETSTLLVDINPAPPASPGSSTPGLLASNGSITWFSAFVPGVGIEPWRTDGTPSGTYGLGDLYPGAGSSLQVFNSSALLGDGRLVFYAQDPAVGAEPRVSDGGPNGTRLLADVMPGPESSDGFQMVSQAGLVWFLADDGMHGTELWVTDGTVGGTELALDFVAGPTSGLADARLHAAGANLFLERRVNLNPFSLSFDVELYSTDGTPGGTTLVSTFVQVQGNASFQHVAALGDDLVFFQRSEAPHGWWISDGTAAGTVLLHAAGYSSWAVGTEDAVYFVAADSQLDPIRLWASDGTPGAAAMVNDWEPSLAFLSATPPHALPYGDGIVYAADVPGSGVELVYTEGTPGTTVLVADVNPGPAGSQPDSFTASGDRVFFAATDAASGRELWSTDATLAGTALVADLAAGPASSDLPLSDPAYLDTANGLVFRGQDDATGYELYRADASSAGILVDIVADETSEPSDPFSFVRLGGRAFFVADDGAHGRELWVTDGTEPGTQLVADLMPGPEDGGPTWLTAFGDRLYFRADSPAAGGSEAELWSTDGTPGGTQQVLDLNPGDPSSAPSSLVVLGDRLLFVATVDGVGRELWGTDGTAGGTALVADLNPGPESSSPNSLTSFAGEVYFSADDGASGEELWATDGTLVGTRQVVDGNPGTGDFLPRLMTPMGDLLFFRALRADTGLEPWVTDGTEAGTLLLGDLDPGTTGSIPEWFAPSMGGMLFTADDGVNGEELWRSDGTVLGTALYDEILVGPEDSGFSSLHSNGELVYVYRFTQTFASQLWSTDGSDGGMQQIAPVDGGPQFTQPLQFWIPGSDGRLAFSAVQPAFGSELWSSDGTPEGTFRVTDSAPGAQYAEPRPGVQLGAQLLFTADDGDTGRELHAVPYVATEGWIAEPLGSGCPGGSGVPQLGATGAAALGSAFALELSQLAPGAPALVFWDDAFAGADAVPACVPLLPAPALLATLVADGAGSASQALAVPTQPSLVGALLYLQGLSVELGGPFLGIGALTPALEVVVGPAQ